MINYILNNKFDLIKFFKKHRWENKSPHCIHCNCRFVYKHGYTKDGYQRYRCKSCKKTFSDKTNTLLHYSRIPLDTLLTCFLLFFYIHTSFNKLCSVCNVSLNSFRRILCKIEIENPKLNEEIELDEMYFKCGFKGRYYSSKIISLGRKPRKRGLKRHKRGRGTYEEDLVPILSIVKRKGDFLLIPISTASEDDIKREVLKYCDISSTFYTDEWRSYRFLENRKYVVHSNREYTDGLTHVNTAEGNHSLFRIFMSVHMGINKNNLSKYITWYRIMRKAGQHRKMEDLICFFISLLVQKRIK